MGFSASNPPPNKRWELTEERRQFLIQHYQGIKGQMIALTTDPRSPLYGISRDALKGWIQRLGLTHQRIRDWSREDDAYLEKHLPLMSYADLSLYFNCSISAVKNRAYHLGLKKSNEGYTRLGVAEIFGCNEKTVQRWQQRGLLRGMPRNCEREGDMWYFSAAELRRFIQRNPAEVGRFCFDWLAVHDVIFGG